MTKQQVYDLPHSTCHCKLKLQHDSSRIDVLVLNGEDSSGIALRDFVLGNFTINGIECPFGSECDTFPSKALLQHLQKKIH